MYRRHVFLLVCWFPSPLFFDVETTLDKHRNAERLVSTILRGWKKVDLAALTFSSLAPSWSSNFFNFNIMDESSLWTN